MKKKDWKKIAIMGLSTGAILSMPLLAETKGKSESSSKQSESKVSESSSEDVDDESADGNLGYHLMTEDELLMQLSPKGIEMYKSLDAEGKGLALLVASARCNGMNPCKGLNACQTKKNECAGKGECKGQGKCAASDKDLAVKLVRDKMASKRAKISPK